MKHTSYLELSRSALRQNFDYLYKLVGNNCLVSHVVKGNAYGHGIEQYVPLALDLGAQHFSTFDAIEAERVYRVINGKVPIMIMGMIENDQLDWAIEKGIEFFVFEQDRLEAAVASAKRQQKKAKVHLEVETGMNRTGYAFEKLNQVATYLKRHTEELELVGLCTHYAGAESIANFVRVEDQYQNFLRATELLKELKIKPQKKHTACSAAAIRLPKTRMDMVRIGIMQYGFWPNKETFITTIAPGNRFTEDPLRRALSWKSKVMSTKTVKQGEYIGYGTSYLAETDMLIATVPVGYSHGFSRSLSNQGRALIRGTRAAVIGNVNMNMMILDVSHVPSVEKGDEVVLIGKQGDLTISVSSFSEFSDQLNYELLTRLPADIERIIVN